MGEIFFSRFPCTKKEKGLLPFLLYRSLTPAAAAIAVRSSELGDYAVPRLLERYLMSGPIG